MSEYLKQMVDMLHVLDNKIGYKDNDRINTSVVKRYETLFAYYLEIVKIILVIKVY